MAKSLRVGIIGVSVDRGWARESHVPAVQKLAGLELTAVTTSHQATASAAAKAFGVRAAYGDAADLFRDPVCDDISEGTSTAPDFHHAVRLARLIDDVILSSQTGIRRSAVDWPV
jgi:predicted dehydrogenase